MNPFMKRAVQLAIKNVEEGGQPFGAVLVKDGEIIAEGVNELHKNYDISGHAEMIAIRKAQARLKTHDMKGFTMYASGHPCSMCLTAMYFSGLTDIYYANSLEDAASVGMNLSGKIYSDLAKPNEEREIVMKHIALGKEMIDPMKLWKSKQL